MSLLTNITRSNGDPKVLQSGPSSFSPSDRLAHNLGWFSIGLGLVEMFAAREIAGLLGMQGKEKLIQAFGVREIGFGFLTLSVNKQTGLACRIAGDALDIATLAANITPENPKRENVGLALALVAGVTLLDVIAAGATTTRHMRRPGGSVRDYSSRTGFPQGIAASRTAAGKGVADTRTGSPTRTSRKSSDGSG